MREAAAPFASVVFTPQLTSSGAAEKERAAAAPSAPLPSSLTPSHDRGAPAGVSDTHPGAPALSCATMILLKAVAVHEGVSIERLVLDLVRVKARQIGLSALARAVLDRVEGEHSRAPP